MYIFLIIFILFAMALWTLSSAAAAASSSASSAFLPSLSIKAGETHDSRILSFAKP